MGRGAWRAAGPGGARVRHDLENKPPPPRRVQTGTSCERRVSQKNRRQPWGRHLQGSRRSSVDCALSLWDLTLDLRVPSWCGRIAWCVEKPTPLVSYWSVWVKDKPQDCFSKTLGGSQVKTTSSSFRFSASDTPDFTQFPPTPPSVDANTQHIAVSLFSWLLGKKGTRAAHHTHINVLQRRVTRGWEERIDRVWFTKLCPSTPFSLLLATELDRPNLTQRKTSPVIQRDRPAISVKPLQSWYSTLEREGNPNLSKESMEPW